MSGAGGCRQGWGPWELLPVWAVVSIHPRALARAAHPRGRAPGLLSRPLLTAAPRPSSEPSTPPAPGDPAGQPLRVTLTCPSLLQWLASPVLLARGLPGQHSSVPAWTLPSQRSSSTENFRRMSEGLSHRGRGCRPQRRPPSPPGHLEMGPEAGGLHIRAAGHGAVDTSTDAARGPFCPVRLLAPSWELCFQRGLDSEDVGPPPATVGSVRPLGTEPHP